MRDPCGRAQRAWRRRWRAALWWVLALGAGLAALQGSAHAVGSMPDSWMLVDTQKHTLSVFRGQKLIDRFHDIAIGRGGFSADRMRGDGTTPLGTFHIDRIRPSSRFVRFFRIDFPRPEHARRAFDAGRIDAHDYRRIVAAFERDQSPPQDTPLGGQLGIHGLGAGDQKVHGASDWTQGCIALTNQQLERLSRWVHLGMRVEVR